MTGADQVTKQNLYINEQANTTKELTDKPGSSDMSSWFHSRIFSQLQYDRLGFGGLCKVRITFPEKFFPSKLLLTLKMYLEMSILE